MCKIQNLGIAKLRADGFYPSVLNSENQAVGDGIEFSVQSPIDGKNIAKFKNASLEQLEQTIDNAQKC